MISIGPSNTFKKWAFGLTGLFITGAGSVGSAGLLLYFLGAASPEVLTVNPTSDASIASTIVSVYFSMLTAYGIVVYDFKGKRFLSNFIVLLVMLLLYLFFPPLFVVFGHLCHLFLLWVYQHY